MLRGTITEVASEIREAHAAITVSAPVATVRLVGTRGRRHRWRDYATPAGRRPVKEFIDDLNDVNAAAIVAAMKEVAHDGVGVARHLRGDIYEVRADGDRTSYRVLFAIEARRGAVLLALEAFRKTTQRTPSRLIAFVTCRRSAFRCFRGSR